MIRLVGIEIDNSINYSGDIEYIAIDYKNQNKHTFTSEMDFVSFIKGINIKIGFNIDKWKYRIAKFNHC